MVRLRIWISDPSPMLAATIRRGRCIKMFLSRDVSKLRSRYNTPPNCFGQRLYRLSIARNLCGLGALVRASCKSLTLPCLTNPDSERTNIIFSEAITRVQHPCVSTSIGSVIASPIKGVGTPLVVAYRARDLAFVADFSEAELQPQSMVIT